MLGPARGVVLRRLGRVTITDADWQFVYTRLGLGHYEIEPHEELHESLARAYNPALIAASTPPAVAQDAEGQISGRLIDAGQSLADQRVELLSHGTSGRQVTTTDANGQFVYTRLGLGSGSSTFGPERDGRLQKAPSAASTSWTPLGTALSLGARWHSGSRPCYMRCRAREMRLGSLLELFGRY